MIRGGGVGVSGNSKAGHDSRYKRGESEIDRYEIDGGKIRDDEVRKKG